MNETIRQENKKEDKKHLGKFFLLLIGGFLLGVVMGIVMAFGENVESLPTAISEATYNFAQAIAPYVGIVYCVMMVLMLFVVKSKVTKMIKAWDGEDEDEYRKIDGILGNALTALNIGTIVEYFFFAVGFEGIVGRSGFADACYFLGFILTLVIVMVGQQIIITMTKEVNPEKKGSIYDTKFVDKWEDSCDEAEKILIYKSAYKTYTKMSGFYVSLWVFCIFGNGFFNFGLMPVTLVSLIWLCNVCIYTYYAKYYEKHPDKIGVFR